MTPRERWMATFNGAERDRLATDYWRTSEFHTALVAEVGCDGDELWRKLGIDVPYSAGPRRLSSGHPLDPEADLWGIRHTSIEYGAGAYSEATYHPLAGITTLREVEQYPWPDPDDFDYSPVAAAVEKNAGHRVFRAGHYEPFLRYCSLRGMEQGYMDLIENQDLAHAILDRIFQFHYEQNRRIFLTAGDGAVDLFYLAEDLGGQSGPLFSLETYRRFLLAHQKKMAQLVKSHGARVFYHTDGAARIFLPDLIEQVGIDILNPLQWRCPGMELPELVRDFGAHVVFHGGIDNQHTLAFGTPDEVREQVRWCGAIMAEHRARWICAPCHNIQSISPVANVLAMYDEASKVPLPQAI